MKDAKPDTWMPLVIGDYLKDTGRLSTEQHGAYLLLIMDYWVNGAPADDDDELCAITHLDLKSWRRHREKLARFFRIEDGHWRHKRIEEELERWAERKARYPRCTAARRARRSWPWPSTSRGASPGRPASARRAPSTLGYSLGSWASAPCSEFTKRRLAGRSRKPERYILTVGSENVNLPK